MKTRMVVNFVHIGFLIAVVAYIIYRMTQLDMTVGLIKTSALPEPPVTTQRIDSITLNIPSAIEGNWNPRCYATELPCVYKVDPRLEARGHSIADGFRLKK